MTIDMLQQQTENGGGLSSQNGCFRRMHTRKHKIFNLKKALVEENVPTVMPTTLCNMYNEMYTVIKYIGTETAEYAILRPFRNYDTEEYVPDHVRITDCRSIMIKV